MTQTLRISFESYSPSQPVTYTLIKVTDHDIDLPAALTAFTDFLRGAGYVFKGSVEIVEDENVQAG